jgi:TonB family protein
MISTDELKDLRERLHLGRHRQGQAQPLFANAILDRRYRPFRGLAWSVIVHFSLAAGLASIPVARAVVVEQQENLREEAVIVDLDELDDALFLPLLGVSDSSSAPSREKKGLIYPGPQPIFSDFEKPTNQIQTILQPALVNPPRLEAPLVLPNIVRLAEPPRPAPPEVQPRFTIADTATPFLRSPLLPSNALPPDVTLTGPARPLAPPSIEPRFMLPESTIANPSILVPLPQTDLTLGDPVALLRQPAAPKPPEPVAPAAADEAKQNLLVLSPTPARRDQPVTVPPGESRGQFSISPDSNLSFPGTEPGTRGTAPPPSPVPEPEVNARSSNADKDPAPPKDFNGPAVPGARGVDPFEGITILGGIGTPPSRNAGNRPNSNPEPLQTSYGITILASGGSGGGLPDFGVFGNEPVQTVYLDMRRTIFDTPLSWTALYAVAQTVTAPVIENAGILALREDVVLPFPINKHRPEWNTDISRKHGGRMVIAFGVINAEGTMEQLSIKESPDPLLNEPVLEALRKWTFRPARRDGQVVPAKILLGIPAL